MLNHHRLWSGAVVFLVSILTLQGSPALLEKHCQSCHNEDKAKGKFEIRHLGELPNAKNVERWGDALDLVAAEEMPPEDESELSDGERAELINYFKSKLSAYKIPKATPPQPRRLNNREFARSVRDALLIEDVGTHQPIANLIGDARYQGFDTHAATLGFSQFHLEQYIEAIRKIVDATILTGPQPKTHSYDIPAEDIIRGSLSQNTRRRIQRGRNGYFDFLDPRLHAFFEPFETVPATGYYEITVHAIGMDRHIYDSKATGVYNKDPIPLAIHMGDRVRTFDLPDDEPMEIKLKEWMAAGTSLKLYYPTDGLQFQGNGNFKFQYRIAHDYLKENDPARYQRVVNRIVPKAPARTRKNPAHWSHWTGEWEGPRPRLLGAWIRGPIFDSWPSQRQINLIGENPTPQQAEQILQPIAERAWRRKVIPKELQAIGDLVRHEAKTSDVIDAFKEGIIAILSSPNFLLLHTGQGTDADQYATKVSYFLDSTLPDPSLRQSVRDEQLDSITNIREELQTRLKKGQAESFVREFPFAWLKLNDINFMAPDPDHYPFYHRKRVSEDMIEEVLTFFRQAIRQNIPLPEFLTANYSFLNADLARIYGISDVPNDSQFRRYYFTDGRRGGLLGMGAFLTVTADSMSTSPIHRAVYVLENFLGIHPKPPPTDVEIKEPDVRQAKTIKEILKAHRSDPNCASCHRGIDPYGNAFENFDPTGAWRDEYVIPTKATNATRTRSRNQKQAKGIPVDASGAFRNGTSYQDIKGLRTLLAQENNLERFVRCFITKLLTYANGVEPGPEDFAELEAIFRVSEENDFRIVDTIAVVIHSPLFRNR